MYGAIGLKGEYHKSCKLYVIVIDLVNQTIIMSIVL